MKARLGIAPIAWWNDDLAELSGDISLEGCLAEARQAGFTGMETGRRFPMDASILGPILKENGISVCGGWFSGLLLDGDIETEEEIDLLMKHSGEGLPLLLDAGHMAFAGGDVLRVVDKHHKRISHVHTKDVRMEVINSLGHKELPRVMHASGYEVVS